MATAKKPVKHQTVMERRGGAPAHLTSAGKKASSRASRKPGPSKRTSSK